YRATTSDRGEFVIPNLLPGPYVATTFGSELDSLGLALETTLSFVAQRDSVLDTTLLIESVPHFTEARCHVGVDPKTPVVDARSPWLLGRVLREGKPVAGVIVSLRRVGVDGEWQPFADRVRTGSDGLFSYCSKLPIAKQIEVEIRRDGRLLHAVR